jgi:hypothetical protein
VFVSLQLACTVQLINLCSSSAILLFSVQFTYSKLTYHTLACHYTYKTTAKSAEHAAKAVTAETQSTKRAAVTAPVPFSSEDNVQEYSAPTTGASAPITTAAAAPAETFSNSNRRLLFDDSISNSDDFSDTFPWSDSDSYSNSDSQDFSDTFSAAPQFSNSDTFSAQQWSDSDN